MQKRTMNRRRLYVLAVLAVGIVLSLVAIPRTSLTAPKVPEDFVLSETGDQPPVTFSHTKHVIEQKLKCTNCHVKVFQMKRGRTAKKHGKLTMAAMQEGKFCGACHNGKRAFSVQVEEKNCARCHVPK